MNCHFCLFIIILLVSCSDNKKEIETPEIQGKEAKLLSISKYLDNFKYQNLSAFSVDSLSWEERSKHYIRLDEEVFNMVWQSDSTHVFSEDPDLSNYFFSIQNRNTNFKEITILAQTEQCCATIWYLIYDEEGRLIDKFAAAFQGADGTWHSYSTGKFIDYNNYVLTTVNHELAETYEWDRLREVYDCDSTITQYTIGKNGAITEKMLLKEPYKKEIVY